MDIDNQAINFQACTADKECSKCYQFKIVKGLNWCCQYDCETRRGMRCGLFGKSRQQLTIEETINELELF